MSANSHSIADALRSIIGSDKRIQPTSAVIAAGGCSTRMGESGTTKQHLLLDGIPVIVHTLLAFERCELICEMVLVAKQDEIPLYEDYRNKYSITKLSRIVAGGETRQESVKLGFDAISPKSKFVAIHDGARCLVTPEIIEKVCRSAYRYRAATAATAARDTVKMADRKGFIDKTVDRDLVWLAQTPQVFYATLYRAACYYALENDIVATDDNMLVEAIQNPVKLVECGRENIKITTPDDLILAEKILSCRTSAPESEAEI